jgi:hypothetical protein
MMIPLWLCIPIAALMCAGVSMWAYFRGYSLGFDDAVVALTQEKLDDDVL